MSVDFSKLVAADAFVGEDDDDTAAVRAAVDLARSYLSGFDWCGEILELYVGDVTVGQGRRPSRADSAHAT